MAWKIYQVAERIFDFSIFFFIKSKLYSCNLLLVLWGLVNVNRTAEDNLNVDWIN